MMRNRGIVAAVAALALGAAGCGSGGLTSAQLTRQANAICKRRTAQFTASMKHAREIRALAVAVEPVVAKAVDDLHALRPPTNAKASYGRFMDIQQAELARVREVAAGGRGSETAAESQARASTLQRLTQQLHITACR